MRLIFLITSLILISDFAFGQSSKTIRTYGITKKTETVIIYSGDKEVASYKEEVEMYNADGEWIEKLTYSSGGELKLRQQRNYEGGEVVDETAIDLNGSGIKEAKPPSFKRVMSTYEKGNLILEKSVSEEGLVIEQKEFRYNKLGDLIEVTTKNRKGELLQCEITEYNNKGLKVLERVFDSQGAILKEKVFQYE